MTKTAKIMNKMLALYGGLALFSIASAVPAQTLPPELSPQALEQIQALQEEKAARTPAQRKISA